MHLLYFDSGAYVACDTIFVTLQDVGYDSALSLIIDIRTVIPGSGTTAPVGWAVLPLFQAGPGRYMASGYYQLPIFKASSCALRCASAVCQ